MRLLIGIVVVAALVVLAGVNYFDRMGTDVVVVNTGRNTIKVRGMLPFGADSLLAVLGVRNLPDELRPGLPAIVRVPGLSGEVTAAPGAISVTLLGQTMMFSAACDSLELDGTTLLGRRTAINLSDLPRHNLKLACR